ncbi:Trm112 family protein [Candidatus Woesearchaeota archaeon]|nr:Trm112 family protein [Candidatus Woesearchaeota archaeon]
MARDPIPKDLFGILACPICKSDLRYNKGKTGLICAKCSAKYPIKDKIPILLPPKGN